MVSVSDISFFKEPFSRDQVISYLSFNNKINIVSKYPYFNKIERKWSTFITSQSSISMIIKKKQFHFN